MELPNIRKLSLNPLSRMATSSTSSTSLTSSNEVDIVIYGSLEYCMDHASKRKCKDGSCCKLHICKFFILETCERQDSECMYGHQLGSDHNKRVLNAGGYKSSDLAEIKKALLRKRCAVFLPSACGRDKCTDANCHFLHMCKFHLKNQCKHADNRCAYGHRILTDHNIDVLRRFGFNLKRSEEAVLRDVRHVINTGTNFYADVDDPDEMAERQENLNRNKCGICVNFLQRKCKSDKCEFLHYKRPYLWQIVSADGQQRRFLPRKGWKIEAFFKQPAVEEVTLKWNGGSATLSFDSVGRSKKFELSNIKAGHRSSFPAKYLNRWSTPSWKQKPTSTWNMRWEWYCKVESLDWIPFGAKDSKGFSSNVTSDFLEEKFLEDPKTPVEYINESGATKWKVMLTFADMTQKNSVTQVSRPVRRRPVPESGKNGTKESTKSEREVPSRPSRGEGEQKRTATDKMKRIEVDAASDEYKSVVKPFEDVRLTVIKVEKVINKRLYRYFMEEKQAWLNNGDEINQQTVYHGTPAQTVDAICERNFDWRRAGSRVGHAYGCGSYFGQNPSVSNGYCTMDPNGCKHIIVTQALVGKSVVGRSDYTLPPAIAPDNDLVRYNSCVNNAANPTMFIIFHQNQLFPNYVVTFK